MKKAIYQLVQDDAFRIEYRKTEIFLITVLTTDKIVFDGLKHHIEFYESDLNKQLYKRIK